MPNKRYRNKRDGSPLPRTDRSKTFHQADSVKAVLAHLTPTLTRVSDQANRQNFWRSWLTERLPPELLPRLSGVVAREGALVIFAESAAWCARLRFVVQELEPQIRAQQPQIQQITVRVLPKT